MTVEFLKFTDFIDELKTLPLWGQPVRVQPYNRSAGDKSGNFRHYTFIIEVAARVLSGEAPEVLICRFITSKTQAAPSHMKDQKRLDWLNRRNERAADILRQTLEAEGFTVRPGLIGPPSKSIIETNPGNLWTDDDLAVPQEGDENE